MGSPSFTFRLERVRSLRERAEEQAREALARELGARLQRETQLRAAGDAARAARAASIGTALRGATAQDLVAAQAFVERQVLAQQSAALNLSRQEAEVEGRRVALAAAAQEREVVERLKVRKRDEHVAEVTRQEQVELDEIALNVHRRGQVAA